MNSIKNNFEEAIRILQPFARKNIRKANFEFWFTLIMLWSGLFASFFFYIDYPLVLLVSIPVTVIFMCRSFVLEHDCGHQSFYRSATHNAIAGSILGFGVMIPYQMWKYIHDSHHMNVGNLDKRDLNPEIWTLTVNEYKNAHSVKKIAYKFVRSRFSRFIIAPTIIYAVVFRLVLPKFSRQAKISVIIHDLLYLVIFWFLLTIMPFSQIFVIVFLPLILFFSIVSYTFYAQHQFEDTYWETEEDWNYKEATFTGSTYLSAPPWFKWLCGNVVYHNVHHLIPAIPFYRLPEAHFSLNNSLEFKPIPISKVWDLLDLKLWDEDKKKLVTFKSIKQD
jgi:acyl-lipid omega-6 desaturase (Delta-12 desaturase)